ncbi:MAG: XdhC family protein [Chloroflexota bacterium]
MSLYQRLAELERTGGAAALATVIRVHGSVPRHVGSKMLVYPDGNIEGSVGGGEMEKRVIAEALQALAAGEGHVIHYRLSDPSEGDPGVCGGEVEVFVEPIQRRPTLVVVGGGHVGRAVAHLARWLGFRVVVCDDRPEFATPQAVPEADAYLACELKELPTRLTVDHQTYLVLATRSVDIDVPGLPALLETPAAYIGVIGSRRRWETCAQQLCQRGVPESSIARVTSPMGLELNAETPEEIALSIMAQIIMLRRGGSGESMRHEARPARAPG